MTGRAFKDHAEKPCRVHSRVSSSEQRANSLAYHDQDHMPAEYILIVSTLKGVRISQVSDSYLLIHFVLPTRQKTFFSKHLINSVNSLGVYRFHDGTLGPCRVTSVMWP